MLYVLLYKLTYITFGSHRPSAVCRVLETPPLVILNMRNVLLHFFITKRLRRVCLSFNLVNFCLSIFHPMPTLPSTFFLLDERIQIDKPTCVLYSCTLTLLRLHTLKSISSNATYSVIYSQTCAFFFSRAIHATFFLPFSHHFL